MNKLVGWMPVLLPAGLLMCLGASAAGFEYFAVHAFDVGTDRECIPKLENAPPAKCVKRR
ncbi:MAG TPA: hypothetical protein VHC22_31260 [Pirellulales bacterium]|nr:hypothetical protein [Pirellulales bacterium]